MVTTIAEILKKSRGQHTLRQFSSHHLKSIVVITPFIELDTINDQELEMAIGGRSDAQDRKDDEEFCKKHKQPYGFWLAQ